MGALVSAETVAGVVEFNLAASQDAVVEVGVTIGSANWHVVKRAVETIGVAFARTVVLLGNTLAPNDAVVRVGDVVLTANWLEEVSGALAAFKDLARAGLLQLNVLAVHYAQVIVSLSVDSADLFGGGAVTGAASAVLAKGGTLAL